MKGADRNTRASTKVKRTVQEHQPVAKQDSPPSQIPLLATVIVPAYEEEKGLPVVLAKLVNTLKKGYEILVIDDGSDDGTSEVARRFPVRLVRHEHNKGKGEAIITGWKNAGSDRIIFIDADDTYPVDIIPRMAEALGEYDMVIGSRRSGQENIPGFNRLGNFVFRTAIRKLYGFKPYDPLTGLWGIRKSQLARCLPTVRRAPDAEIAMKAARMKLKMTDIPIVYSPRIGQTKLNPFKGGWEHLKLIVTLLFWKPKKVSS